MTTKFARGDHVRITKADFNDRWVGIEATVIGYSIFTSPGGVGNVKLTTHKPRPDGAGMNDFIWPEDRLELVSEHEYDDDGPYSFENNNDYAPQKGDLVLTTPAAVDPTWDGLRCIIVGFSAFVGAVCLTELDGNRPDGDGAFTSFWYPAENLTLIHRFDNA